MRTAFINTLTELAGQDPSINLIVGDLGFGVVGEFAAKFPQQFLNAGVAEQNMTGIAAGMALTGKRTVFTYSIANFPTLRCLEQIRNDVCYHQANVKIVSIGAGVVYGTQGYTHFAVEDLAVLRAMPSIVVANPADPAEALAVTRLACENSGPWYIRLGKNREPAVHQNGLNNLQIGEAIEVCDGTNGTLIASGAITHEAYLAVQEMRKENMNLRLLSVPFIKPLDRSTILRAIKETGWIMTIEEHNGFGGLGSAVAEIMAELGTTKRLERMFLPELIKDLGNQAYLRKLFGLDCEGIITRIRNFRHSS